MDDGLLHLRQRWHAKATVRPSLLIWGIDVWQCVLICPKNLSPGQDIEEPTYTSLRHVN